MPIVGRAQGLKKFIMLVLNSERTSRTIGPPTGGRAYEGSIQKPYLTEYFPALPACGSHLIARTYQWPTKRKC